MVEEEAKEAELAAVNEMWYRRRHGGDGVLSRQRPKLSSTAPLDQDEVGGMDHHSQDPRHVAQRLPRQVTRTYTQDHMTT